MTKSNTVDTLIPPPLICSINEYHELLSLASSIESYADAQQELLDCSRYGELDSVRALLEIWSRSQPDFVNTKNELGCTALHFAAANGHERVVHLLLSAGALHSRNTSGGNTPLHWAAQNSHAQVIQLLLNHPPFRFHSSSNEQLNNKASGSFAGIDVLEKNDFGRSALTEGFGSRNHASDNPTTLQNNSVEVDNQDNSPDDNQVDDEHTKMIGMLLEHDSATDERLIGGDWDHTNDNLPTTEMDVDSTTAMGHSEKCLHSTTSHTNKNSNASYQRGVTHEFNFGSHEKTIQLERQKTATVLVRELPIKNADSPFGESASQDTTGLSVWCASLVSARWLFTLSTVHRRFDNKVVLELGTGCGAPGLTVALFSRARTVYLTDFNTLTMENLKYNIDLNATRDTWNHVGKSWFDRVVGLQMDWADSSTWPIEAVDCIIGSDLIYQKTLIPILKHVIHELLNVGGSFFYVCPSDCRDGLEDFVSDMKTNNFACVFESLAPIEYRENPLSNSDEEEAFLHFYELPVTDYMLLEFVKR